MKRLFATLLIAGSLISPASAQRQHAVPPVTTAKSCIGYTKAIIGGKIKCLRRGQYCALRYQRDYKKYGFRCTGGRLR